MRRKQLRKAKEKVLEEIAIRSYQERMKRKGHDVLKLMAEMQGSGSIRVTRKEYENVPR
jgi:hypothetical protein